MTTTALPYSQERVRSSTRPAANVAIREHTARSVANHLASNREALTQRIEELDHEWDIERALQLNMGTVMLITLGLARTHDKRWLGMTGVVAGFFLQHALQGWCPPVVPMRAAGIRTPREIAEERTALRILRGDYQQKGEAES